MGVFTRPRVDITVNADSIDVQGLRSRSGLAPVFHVIRQAATRPWVIVGGPGLDLVQPAQFALYVLIQRTSLAPFPHTADDFVGGLAIGLAIGSAIAWFGGRR